jgi:hypothetical protein
VVANTEALLKNVWERFSRMNLAQRTLSQAKFKNHQSEQLAISIDRTIGTFDGGKDATLVHI